jgi:hypothetical protein
LRSRVWSCLSVLSFLCAAGAAAADLVINEFLPDPSGSDGGREFVELLNPGDHGVDLGGWQLQFANGAEGAVWQTRWTGQAGQTVPAGGRFLIVDRNWLEAVPGDAEVALALQNGPDAIRLTHEGRLIDLVGYGALTDTLLMEAAPAPISVGRSTARRPDGRDTGDNAADFVAATPTPGAPNFERWLLTAVETSLEPPSLGHAGQAVSVGVLLRNDGIEPLATARLRLVLGLDVVEATLDAMPPGSERRVDWTLRPTGTGRLPLAVTHALPDGSDTLRVALGDYQIGPAELVLHEVSAAPRAGQGEWLELAAPGPDAVPLADYRIRDEDGGWAALPDLLLLPGELAVVAQDSQALGDWLAANTDGPADARGCGSALHRLGSWPSLNNTAPDSRAWADRVQLADSSGTVIDHVTLDAGDLDDADGRSLERIALVPAAGGASNWAVSLAAAGGTPGCANSVSGRTGLDSSTTLLVAVPAVADRTAGDAAIHLAFNVPPTAEGWDLALYDLDGRRVRDLGGDRLGAGPREIFWDLRDDRGDAVATGGYVAALRMTAAGVAASSPVRLLLVVR